MKISEIKLRCFEAILTPFSNKNDSFSFEFKYNSYCHFYLVMESRWLCVLFHYFSLLIVSQNVLLLEFTIINNIIENVEVNEINNSNVIIITIIIVMMMMIIIL